MDQEILMRSSSVNVSFGMHGDTNRYAEYRVTARNGESRLLNISKIRETIESVSADYRHDIDVELIVLETVKNIFDGVSKHELFDALIMATISCVEKDPAYGYVAARLLLKKLYREITNTSITKYALHEQYSQSFVQSIEKGVAYGLFDSRLLDFDLKFLSKNLKPERDNLFDFMGLRTLYERYFAKYNRVRIEMPQAYWMRIAMGLCYNEQQKNERAVQFYNIMSCMDYIPGTPTLLHSGMVRPQLSSCFLTTISDDLVHIFKCFGDNAQLSKWSGGVANDWTPLRATGSRINSINSDSQGVIPFLKIANDVTAAISRSGSRRGATCVYLETWHFDIEDFIDLRKNTGDERRRTHDINTANWIPDLFMKRVIEDGVWSLFSPDEVPELHELYGKAFEEKYIQYEKMGIEGKLSIFKQISATQLWRKMLSRLFETGHPWITFKDSFNVRSPQDHVGVIHSTNLCTEISLNTSKDETAVCNLGSVNLSNHIIDGKLDDQKLEHTISCGIRMLDNVIDINFYPTIEAQNANMRHRAVGLGIMGLQDAFYKLDLAFDDPRAREFSEDVMEKIAYNAILGSSQLAKERGTYSSYKGSKWDRNIFPQDTIDMLEQERGVAISIKRNGKLDWTPVREHVRAYGMRNSNTMAIAPTATISTIVGCFPCIEPIYKNMYVKSNMNGEFTIINKYLVADLKKMNMWNQSMVDQLKYFDGSIQYIAQIPDEVKRKYKEVFEIDPLLLVEMTAYRGKWVDQSQSHNVFMKGVSGKLLSDIFIAGWKLGLKSFYYLRTLGASQIEKSTLDAKYGFTQKRQYDSEVNPATKKDEEQEISNAQACSILNGPDCEVCQ